MSTGSAPPDFRPSPTSSPALGALHDSHLLHSTPHARALTLVSPLHSHSPVERTKRSGFYDIGIAGGIETMSSNPMAWDGSINPRISDFEKAQGCLLPMGLTSENVAKKYGITRLEQDKFAVESHAR